MTQHKKITWSPKVSPIHRKSHIKKSKIKQSASTITIKTAEQTQVLKGESTIHARHTTRNSLLTIRDTQGKRIVQLLIDIPNTKIRRVYDGSRAWEVHPEGNKRMNIRIALGTITWLDDENRKKKSDARGFDISGLENTWKLHVNPKPPRTLHISHVNRSQIPRRPRSILKRTVNSTSKMVPKNSKRVASKRVASKRVASKRVASKRVASKRGASKRGASKRGASKRGASKRGASKR